MKKICILITLFLITIFTGNKIFAQTCVSTEDCNNKISEYTNQIANLQGQANTLKNQIAQFDAQIKLTTLKINQTQSQITLLGGRIDQVGDSVDNLTSAFSKRVLETYKLSRFENNFSFVMSSSDLTQTFSKFYYLKRIQDEDKRFLDRLTDAKNNYEGQKKDQEDLQKTLQKQQTNLNAQKSAKNQLLIDTKNNEAIYQKLIIDARKQIEAFNKFVANQGGAKILNGTTKDDSGWGKYYNQRDSQWGNKALGISNISVADAGCLITSMSMIMTHYGKVVVPSDISSNPSFFTSYPPYADFRQGSLTINGTNTTRIRVGYSQASLDVELSLGKPVIVGVSPYGSQKPEHFVVVKRKEGSNYIMNDPFIENGMNAMFLGHYSPGSIRAVDRVVVN